MNCKEIKRNNQMARRAYILMLGAKTKHARTFWRNAVIFYTYGSLRAWK